MSVKRVLAQFPVTDLDRAVQWYSIVLGAEPDARPMDGLVEWQLGESFGVQLWRDADRAGRSTAVFEEADLDALEARLDQAGVDHPPITAVTASRILQLEDPDGNRVMITGV